MTYHGITVLIVYVENGKQVQKKLTAIEKARRLYTKLVNEGKNPELTFTKEGR